jgi:protein arginine N-methyltransferase 1
MLEELPGGRLRVRAGGREFIVDGACPHRLGRLVHGYVNPRTLRLTCPLHRTSFDLATGCPVSGPAERALTVYQTGVLGQDYRAEQVWLPASERLPDWDDSFHDLMLGDTLRMTAFQAAVRETVRPGDVVLDVGTGTGILARWALEAGAARVYGLDMNRGILAIAAERLAAAGFGPDRFHPLPGLSFDVTPPERVDVVVSEILGNLVDNENCVAILADAGRRFLKPGGRMLPRRASTYLVPVAAGQAHAQLAQGTPEDAGSAVEFASLLSRRGAAGPFDLYYDTILPTRCQLAVPQLARRHHLAATGPDPGHTGYSVTRDFPILRDGLLTGFKGYFVAALSDSVTLDISGDTISPASGRTTSDSWKHCYLPIAEPVPVRAGDRVVVTFARTAAGGTAFGQRYRWAGRADSAFTTVARFAQHTGPGRTAGPPTGDIQAPREGRLP